MAVPQTIPDSALLLGLDVVRARAAGRLVGVFEGYDLPHVDVAEDVRLRVRIGGEGEPVVLLHGHPRTHTTWQQVAPQLVKAGHTVVCPDLRGYGRSTCPPPQPDHGQASKRQMAGDVRTLMTHLGHERFAVVGHDRGSYVAFRLAMDHPDAVARLVLIDCVPIAEALARADARLPRPGGTGSSTPSPTSPSGPS